MTIMDLKWIPFDTRYKLAYDWPKRFNAFKASVRSVFKTKQLESFPVNENPFWHDSFHMGTYVAKNLLVMHRSHDSENAEYIILCHVPSGQRIKVSFPKERNC